VTLAAGEAVAVSMRARAGWVRFPLFAVRSVEFK